ncbi:diguanylate cyclase (GGDEF) domain-containing protein [Thermanaerovibrio velox DSM 12556]|uniref:histidine kinase n=1 Tax=Thermanaerovibrio velox DSM 12556 TaxID=926567 RepID=H0UQR1_9BACT|nr:diguanylate cyclase [Thermanaerovibrio velox]EHM10825.1 diguanylate cyclase (GGDEF) domain-containing protein [Thermanaerovibrio velox DSM 12556]
MNTSTRMLELERRFRLLEEERERVNRILAVAVGLVPASVGDEDGVERIIVRAADRARSLIKISRWSCRLFSDDGLELYRAAGDEGDLDFQGVLEALSSDGTLAWALTHPHPMFLSLPQGNFLVAALSTPSRIMGVFLASLEETPEEVPEIGVAFFRALMSYAAVSIQNTMRLEEVRSLNRRLEDNVQRLEETKRALEEANRLKDAFLAHIGHEIRNPLGGIIGLLRGMWEEALPVGYRDRLEVLLSECETLNSLLDDLLDYSKLEAGRLDVLNVPYSPVELMESLGASFGLRAKDKGLEFRFFHDRLPDRVMGDPRRIRQVLVNLLSNSLKFTRRGHISLSGWASDGKLYFAVEDSGEGMDQEQLEQLFVPFAGSSSGIGLGLCLSKGLVNRMGGDINVRSRRGHGTAFTVELPLSGAVGTGCPLEGLKGLVVDDNNTSLAAACGVLRECGVEAMGVASPEEAIQIAAGEEFDFILMDLNLPAFDGLTLLRRLREVSSAKIVGLTAGVGQEEEDRFIREGLLMVLRKPLDLGELAWALRQGVPPQADLRSDLLETFRSDMARLEGVLLESFRQGDEDLFLKTVHEFKGAALSFGQWKGSGMSHFRVPMGVSVRFRDVEFPEGMRMLVADDSRSSREGLERIFAPRGIRVFPVSDGEEALKVLLSGAVDVALVDCMMPRMDGVEVIRRLREAEADSERYTYVIMITVRDTKEDLVRAMASGADDYVVKPFDPDDLTLRVLSGTRVMEVQRKLRFLARHDPLTGLYNRAALLEMEEREISRALREGANLSVAMMDIDRFKAVNDRYGHLAGDEVLRQLSCRVKGLIRPYDILGRYGGEEFLMVLPGASIDGALRLCERVRRGIELAPVEYQGELIPVTASFGVAQFREGMSLDRLNDDADQALYRAKGEGRNRVVAFEG